MVSLMRRGCIMRVPYSATESSIIQQSTHWWSWPLITLHKQRQSCSRCYIICRPSLGRHVVSQPHPPMAQGTSPIVGSEGMSPMFEESVVKLLFSELSRVLTYCRPPCWHLDVSSAVTCCLRLHVDKRCCDATLNKSIHSEEKLDNWQHTVVETGRD